MRSVRVATVSLQYRGGPTVDANREMIRELLDQAVAERPDIVALPETFVSQGVAHTGLEQIAEPIPGPTTDLVAAYARAHQCYILCPLMGDHGASEHGRFQNNAVLIDRQGDILTTNRENLSVADIVAEFNLDPLDAYLSRNRALQDAVRAGEAVPDLTPPYVGCNQWS
jgi:predicted amidohydrolase